MRAAEQPNELPRLTTVNLFEERSQPQNFKINMMVRKPNISSRVLLNQLSNEYLI